MRTLELLSKVADGSAAEAFLARTERETVLIELSRPDLSNDMELYGRFLDETHERQKFSHPNLVKRTGSGCRQDGRLYALTESLSGLHLGSLCPMSPDRAVDFLLPLCDALAYLHEHDEVHGNLRPSHVFLSGDPSAPVPKLLDMGLLLFRSTKSMQAPDHVVLVAAEYLSPERILGHRASPRSDIYGLGVLAVELVTGSPPFRGADAEATRRLHLNAPVPRLPDEASWMQPWINRCMGKDPQSRFATMAQVREALLDVNRSRATSTPVPLRGAPSAEEVLTAGRDNNGTVSMRSPTEEPPVVKGKLEEEAKQLGPYHLEKLLGEGGMGQVWLAKHTRLGRLVAIKLLRPELANVEQQVQRFVQEARAVNRVNHPHIVEIHDFVEEREFGRVWCVMEYLKGATLKTLGREGPMSIARSIGVVRQVCDALEAAHKVGVVHRDIKPDNIFLVEGKGTDFVKVLDFGVAKLREERPGNSHTDTGEIVGTPAYMSPEQALGQDVDARSDLYSLGTLLYVMLAGRFPFDGVTAGQMVANIVTKPPLPLPAVARSGEPIPPALEQVAAKALMKNPSQRYRSMAELSQALAEFETTQPVSTIGDEDVVFEVDEESPGAKAEAPVSEPSGRGPRWATWLVGMVVVASAAAAGGWWWPHHGAARQANAAPIAAPRVDAQVKAGPVEVAAPAAPQAPPAAVAAELPAPPPPPPVLAMEPAAAPEALKAAPVVKKPLVVKRRHGGR